MPGKVPTQGIAEGVKDVIDDEEVLEDVINEDASIAASELKDKLVQVTVGKDD